MMKRPTIDKLLARVLRTACRPAMEEAANAMEEAAKKAPHSFDFDLRRRHVRRLMTLEGTDIADSRVMSGAWR